MTYEDALAELDSRLQSAKEQHDWLTFWDLLSQYEALMALKSEGYVSEN